jgi:hypothetical protein
VKESDVKVIINALAISNVIKLKKSDMRLAVRVVFVGPRSSAGSEDVLGSSAQTGINVLLRRVCKGLAR